MKFEISGATFDVGADSHRCTQVTCSVFSHIADMEFESSTCGEKLHTALLRVSERVITDTTR
jgi:hypothetical protein